MKKLFNKFSPNTIYKGVGKFKNFTTATINANPDEPKKNPEPEIKTKKGFFKSFFSRDKREDLCFNQDNLYKFRVSLIFSLNS
jgi:hypothetical protein